jgi:hypothetical protein
MLNLIPLRRPTRVAMAKRNTKVSDLRGAGCGTGATQFFKRQTCNMLFKKSIWPQVSVHIGTPELGSGART